MKYEYAISPEAQNDISGIYGFIIEKNNPASAENVVSAIYEAIDYASNYPTIGMNAERHFGYETDYLFLVALPYPYLVFYKFTNKKVYIHRVLDGRRDCVKILNQ